MSTSETTIPALCVCASVSQLPQALFSWKKHTPDFLSTYFVDFVICVAILESPGKVYKIWPLCSNDYASKTRIEIVCKKTCCIAPHLFSKPHLLGYSRNY